MEGTGRSDGVDMIQKSDRKPDRMNRAVAIWLISAFLILSLVALAEAKAPDAYELGPTVAIAYDKAVISKTAWRVACFDATLTVDPQVNPPLVKPGATSQLTFTVRNESGDPVPAADVSVSSPGGTLNPSSGKTNAAGRFPTSFSSQHVGTFTVTASVSKTGYCSASASTQVTVDSTPPQAQFVADPPSSSAVPNESVTFDGSASSGAEGANIASWSWNFGDNQTGSGKTVTHAYTKSGTYSVLLTVTDNHGKTDSSPMVSYIVSAPVPVTTTTVPVTNITTAVPVTNITTAVPGGATTTPGANATAAGNATPPVVPLFGIPLELIAGVLLLVLIVAAVLAWLWTRSRLVLKPKVKEIPADGRSATPIRIQFVNGFGSAKKQRSDREIHLEATAGRILDMVIPAGREYADATLTASKECGLVLVTATTEDKAKATTEVRFTGDEAGIEVEITPAEIPADGNSTATIVLKIRDRNGMYLTYLDEKIIGLTTTLGAVPAAVRVEPRAPYGTATIISGNQKGTALVRASTGSIAGEGKVQFKELGKRYCMHCGFQMAMEAPFCPNCGKIPPSGVDTKQCSTCNAVLPQPATFCDKCGARQPQ
jgi:PKD repeat protein/ribosomal protein L40E